MSFDNRPDHPMKSEIFVKLVTESELRKNTVKNFYNTVKENSPEGVFSAYHVKDPDGNPTESLLVHRITEDGRHEYEIPLLRNLTANEIYEVAMNLDRVLNEGNFLFETSTFDEECCVNEDDVGLYMEPDLFEQFATKLSQRMHDKWMHERIDAGWRYGSERCDEDMTHPLVKPWEQLTEEQQSIDYKLPEFVIDLFEEFGYTVVSHEELDEMIEEFSKRK